MITDISLILFEHCDTVVQAYTMARVKFDSIRHVEETIA